MKCIHHSPEQIILKLREADANLANGVSLADIFEKLDIAKNIDYYSVTFEDRYAANRCKTVDYKLYKNLHVRYKPQVALAQCIV